MEDDQKQQKPHVYAVRMGRQCGLVGTPDELIQLTSNFRNVEYAVFESGLAAAAYVGKDALVHKMLPTFPPATVFVELLTCHRPDGKDTFACIAVSWHTADGTMCVPLVRTIANNRDSIYHETLDALHKMIAELEMPPNLTTPPSFYLALTELNEGESTAFVQTNALVADLELHIALRKRLSADRTVFDPELEKRLDKLAVEIVDTKRFVLQNGNEIHHLYPFCLLFSTAMREMHTHLQSKA